MWVHRQNEDQCLVALEHNLFIVSERRVFDKQHLLRLKKEEHARNADRESLNKQVIHDLVRGLRCHVDHCLHGRRMDVTVVVIGPCLVEL